MTGPEQLNKVNLAENDNEVLIGEDLQPHIEAHLVKFLTTILMHLHGNMMTSLGSALTSSHTNSVSIQTTPPSNKKEGNLEQKGTKS